MIAAIDVGNARIKWALAESGRLRSEGLALPLDEDGNACEALIGALPDELQAVFVSNVAGKNIEFRLSETVRERFGFAPRFAASERQYMDLRCAYEDPAAFGVDRWLAMIAAYHTTERPFCVIDAGTAVTFDAVDAQAAHVGGLIFAGPGLIAEALSAGTEGIAADPELPDRPRGADLFADSTTKAVNYGAWLAVSAALDRALERASDAFGVVPSVLLTGGGGPILAAWLDTPVVYRPDLVLEGLVLSAAPRI